VLDEVGRVLVAGDALVTQAGAVGPPPAQFTEDMDQAMASIGTLATLGFDTLLVGHGAPIERDASALVAELVGP
jgi:glyoxylase-like metal-dependent hydrolase (beta-lactamase superfamily II)